MGAKKQRSKKQSGASSNQQPERATFYLDRNIGRHTVADALRAVACKVEVHDDHLPIDAPDEDWIELIASRGWIGVTKDKNIRYRTAEIEAIKQYRARVLVVRAKNTSGRDMAEILVQHHVRILHFFERRGAPLIAGIDRAGSISAYKIEQSP